MSDEPPRLTPETIVQAAIKVAERDGLDAVSMRRVGAQLGYSGMSLYTHLDGKDALLDLMADHVIGLVPDIRDEPPWQTAVAEFFTNLRTVLLEHRHLAPVFTMRPTRGPHTQRHSRHVLDRIIRGGLEAGTAVEAYIALSCYTMGSALYAAARTPEQTPDAWATLGDGILPPEAARQLATRAESAQFQSGLVHLIAGFAGELGGRAAG